MLYKWKRSDLSINTTTDDCTLHNCRKGKNKISHENVKTVTFQLSIQNVTLSDAMTWHYINDKNELKYTFSAFSALCCECDVRFCNIFVWPFIAQR